MADIKSAFERSEAYFVNAGDFGLMEQMTRIAQDGKEDAGSPARTP